MVRCTLYWYQHCIIIDFLPDYVYDLYFTKELGAVDMETATL